mgnify:CR=1 FL=1
MDPFVYINTEKDIVRLDGQKIKFRREFETIILHKPKGFICSRSDELHRKTIFDLIPKKATLNYIGRLDKNTTGIILLTSDGNLSQFLTHPKNKISKEYIAEATAQIQESQVKKITEKDRELDLKTFEIPYEERDHALYIAFGPYKNPSYAVSIIVEHGGSGSSTAAPIAKKLFKSIIDRHELREQTRKQNLATT